MSTAAPDAVYEVNEYMPLLEAELQSCCQPKIKNVSEASEIELIRDLHRVLTGNGDATHGLIFKVAAANVNIKLLSRDFNITRRTVDEQVERCSKFRAAHDRKEALQDASRNSLRHLGMVLWENKALVGVLLLATVMYVRSALTAIDPKSLTAADVTELVEKAVLKHVNK